jgi:hypothetical protein
MPSLASIDRFARVGDASCDRGKAKSLLRLRGRGCRSSVADERSCSDLFSGGDRFGEYSAGGKIGSILDVRGRGLPGLLLICGGGVMDMALGVW